MTSMTEEITTEQRLAELETKRRRLALDAQEGKPDAPRELDQIEAAIASLKRDQERLALAGREREKREATARAEAAAKHRRQFEARLAALTQQRRELAAEVDATSDALVAALGRLLSVGREMYQTTFALGENRARLTLETLLGQWLRALLSPQLPHEIERPAHGYRDTLYSKPRPDAPLRRRPLAEIIAPEILGSSPPTPRAP